MSKNKYFLLEKIVNRIEKDLIEDKIPFFPLIDPNKINLGYFGSREFLGDNVWLWKEMRKK